MSWTKTPGFLALVTDASAGLNALAFQAYVVPLEAFNRWSEHGNVRVFMAIDHLFVKFPLELYCAKCFFSHPAICQEDKRLLNIGDVHKVRVIC